MADKQLLFSITKDDFDMQTFSVGGHGGGGKDTSNSGVRLIHRASGATGEGREARSNTLNRRSAFQKLVASKKFKDWHRIECARRMGRPVEETPRQRRESGMSCPRHRTSNSPLTARITESLKNALSARRNPVDNRIARCYL
jgi:protein subunit release factor A